MTSNRNFNNISIGGNYIESVQGHYVEGNYITIRGSDMNINRELKQVDSQVEQLLDRLKSQGFTQEYAQQKVADDLVNQAHKDARAKSKLIKWGENLKDAATNGVIGEAAVVVLKIALAGIGITLP